jgi:hypothetical protein
MKYSNSNEKVNITVKSSAIFPTSLNRTNQTGSFALALRNYDESHLRLVKVGKIRTIKEK